MADNKKPKAAGRHKNKYDHYRAVRSVPNKRRKLARHLASHPNDELAHDALAKVGK